MTERPIIFTGESIRAILAGRKTQTRRMVKPLYGSSEWNVAWSASGREGTDVAMPVAPREFPR